MDIEMLATGPKAAFTAFTAFTFLIFGAIAGERK